MAAEERGEGVSEDKKGNRGVVANANDDLLHQNQNSVSEESGSVLAANVGGHVSKENYKEAENKNDNEGTRTASTADSKVKKTSTDILGGKEAGAGISTPISALPRHSYAHPYTHHILQPPTGYPIPPAVTMTGQFPLNPLAYTDATLIADPVPDNRRNRGGVTQPFPDKLHQMLDVVEREGMADVVGWFKHGRAFGIHKPRRFVELLPRFFNQSRLTSFQRQLNLYGFRRLSQGPDNGGYYHELFLRGRPGLSVNMRRTKDKGTFAKKKRDPATEPNFHNMPPVSSSKRPAASSGNSPPAIPATVSSPNGSPTAVAPPSIPASYVHYNPFPNHQPAMVIPRPVGPYTAAQRSTAQVYPDSSASTVQPAVSSLPKSPPNEDKESDKKCPAETEQVAI